MLATGRRTSRSSRPLVECGKLTQAAALSIGARRGTQLIHRTPVAGCQTTSGTGGSFFVSRQPAVLRPCGVVGRLRWVLDDPSRVRRCFVPNSSEPGLPARGGRRRYLILFPLAHTRTRPARQPATAGRSAAATNSSATCSLIRRSPGSRNAAMSSTRGRASSPKVTRRRHANQPFFAAERAQALRDPPMPRDLGEAEPDMRQMHDPKPRLRHCPRHVRQEWMISLAPRRHPTRASRLRSRVAIDTPARVLPRPRPSSR